MQRNKGAAYEREVCNVLTEKTGKKVQRHIGQSRDGGNDITVGSLVIECKRRKTLGTIEGWLAQAKAAVVHKEQTPIVVARSDGGESLAVLSFAAFLRIVSPETLGLTPEDIARLEALRNETMQQVRNTEAPERVQEERMGLSKVPE